MCYLRVFVSMSKKRASIIECIIIKKAYELPIQIKQSQTNRII